MNSCCPDCANAWHAYAQVGVHGVLLLLLLLVLLLLPP
jgi:hypothetical protein